MNVRIRKTAVKPPENALSKGQRQKVELTRELSSSSSRQEENQEKLDPQSMERTRERIRTVVPKMKRSNKIRSGKDPPNLTKDKGHWSPARAVSVLT